MTGCRAWTGTGPAGRRAGRVALLALCALAFGGAAAQAQSYYGRNNSNAVTVDESVLESLGPPRQPQTLNNPWTGPQPVIVPAPGTTPDGSLKLKRPPEKSARKAAVKKKKKPSTEAAATPAPAESAPPPSSPAEAKPAAKAASAKAGKDTLKANPPPAEVKAAGDTPMPALPPTPAVPGAASGPASSSPAPSAPVQAAPAPPVTPPSLPAPPAPAKQLTATKPTPVTPPAAAATTAATAPSVTPPTPAAPAAPAAPPAQTATRSPAVPLGDGTRVVFSGDEIELNDAAKQALGGLVAKMQATPSARVQLLAYASGAPEQASKARRTSLSRALAVRTYLLAQGVQSTRIDVRALGNTIDDPPIDRVDAVFAKP